MAMIPRASNVAVRAEGQLFAAAGYTVVAYRQGAIVSGDPVSLSIPVYAGHSIKVGDKFASFRPSTGVFAYYGSATVTVVTPTLINVSVNAEGGFVAGDMLVTLDVDTSSGSVPNFTASDLEIFVGPQAVAAAKISQSRITVDAGGGYQFHTRARGWWEIVVSPTNKVRDVVAVRGSSEVTPFEWGAKGDDVNNDTAAINAALASGLPEIYFPATTGYKITAALSITTAGQSVRGDGYGSLIKQYTLNKMVFDVLANDVTIEGFRLTNPGGKVFLGGTFRGNARYMESSGVFTYFSRGTFRNLNVDGFVCGVNLSPYDVGLDAQGGPGNTDYGHTSPSPVPGKYDNVVDGLTVNNVDFGVLCNGQYRAWLDRVYGVINLAPSSTNHPHLIYATGIVASGYACYDLYIGRAIMKDSTSGFTGVIWAVQITDTYGARVEHVESRKSWGAFNMLRSEDVHVGDVLAFNDVNTANSGAVVVQDDANVKRCRFERIFVDMDVAGRAVRAGGEDCTYDEIYVRSAWDAADGFADILLAGSRNVIRRAYVQAKTAFGGAAVYQSGAADNGNVVQSVEARGVKFGVHGDDGYGLTVGIEPAAVTFKTGLTNSGSTGESGTNTARLVELVAASKAIVRVRRPPRVKVFTVAGVFGITEEASAYSAYQLNWTAGAVTVNNPSTPSVGLELSVLFINNSGGAFAAITWGGDFNLAAAFTGPAAGKRAVVHFQHDGVDWKEVSRVASP